MAGNKAIDVLLVVPLHVVPVEAVRGRAEDTSDNAGRAIRVLVVFDAVDLRHASADREWIAHLVDHLHHHFFNVALQKTVISLCTGYAGLDLGLRLAGLETKPLAYVEREGTVVQRLVARFKDQSLDEADIWSDLRTFDGRPYRGKTDILTAGYPCQPFSCAGKRKGKHDVRHLWPEVARIIRETEARQVFLENVDAHLRLGGYEVLHELSAMGYRVAGGLFTAAEVGAPHRRRRLFILAERMDDGNTGCLAENRQIRAGRHAAKLPGGALADSNGAHCPTGKELHLGGRPHETARSDIRSAGLELPAFPPGPEDFGSWSRLLVQHPEVEPAVCGASDGRSNRVDELRALGNGVVPIVAAHAYLTLDAALRDAA